MSLRARSMRSAQAGRSDARDMRRRARSGHDSGSSCPSLSGPDLMIRDNYSHTVTAVHARARRRSLLFRKHWLLPWLVSRDVTFRPAGNTWSRGFRRECKFDSPVTGGTILHPDHPGPSDLYQSADDL